MSVRRALLAVAQGQAAPDAAVTGGTVADVYAGEWVRANVEIARGRIAYVGPRVPRRGPDTVEIDATGRVVVPGYVEPHAHPWVLYSALGLLEAAVPDGTTAIVLDSLFQFQALGAAGHRRIVEALRAAPANVWWNVRAASQSRFREEPETFTRAAFEEQLAWPEVALSGEITRWRDVAGGDAHLLAAIAAAHASRRRAEGHAAGASYERLAALSAAGISADHEAITAEEARRRIGLGMWTMLRQSSLRPDLRAILDGLGPVVSTSRRLMLTTDGATPAHYARHGVLSGALAIAVAAGVDPMRALQMATIDPATFLGLDEEIGGIAPGRRASLLLLDDRDAFRPRAVLVDGRLVARGGRLLEPVPALDWDALGCRAPFAEPERFADPALYATPADRGATLDVMAYESAVITRRAQVTLPARDGRADVSAEPGLLHAALVDRRGAWIVHGLVSGLMPELDGLATSLTTSRELLVLGRDPRAMARAAARVAELRGGIALAGPDGVRWEAQLPVLGMMNAGGLAEAVRIEQELARHASAAGYPFHDVLYSLLFATGDFLPELRLTPIGLLEVKSGAVLAPPVALRDGR
ncbi:MAG: adenine deaminase [Solirubrobacteraceae bacterium]|nr:adenine deaminase [Solirubrobacteraceae bacterium]